MYSKRLTAEVRRFNAAEPIEEARTPPSSWYLDESIFRLELDAVFGQNWHYVGHKNELPDKGRYVTTQMGRNPVVAVHDGERVNIMHNVCRHHAACVMEGKGACEALVCPYHGWTYHLDGSLKRAPKIAGISGFSREDMALPQLPQAAIGPLLFAHPGQAEESAQWEEKMRSLHEQFDAFGWSHLTFVRSRTYAIKCNWKVFVDNYLDGGYHVSLLHKGLAGQLNLADYENHAGDGYTIQTCKGRPDEVKPSADQEECAHGLDFRARIGQGAIYAWIYPNLMINRYGGMMDTNLVVPLGPDHCEVHYAYFADEAVAADAQQLEDSLAASHQVQIEDTAICESVQRGLQSSAYDVGYYAPQLESGAHLFHRWLQKDFFRALDDLSD